MRSNKSVITPLNDLRHLAVFPKFPDDDNKTRMAYILTSISIIGLILTLIYSVLWIFLVSQSKGPLILAPLAFLSFGMPLVLIRQKRLTFAKIVFFSGTWILITAGAAWAGGTRSPFFAGYTLLILGGFFLAGWRTAFTFLILAFIAGFVMVSPAYLTLGINFVPTPWSGWLTQMSIMVMLTSAAYFIFRHTEADLNYVQKELVERQKVEESLRLSEERFRLISSVISDYTFSWRFNEPITEQTTFITGAFEKITGYTQKEFLARGGFRTLLHPDSLEQDERDNAALGKNQTIISELKIITKSGEVRWVRVYAHPIWDTKENRLEGISGAVQDIHERKQAEIALQSENELIDAVINTLSGVFFMYDISATLDGKLIRWNKNHETLTGYSSTELSTMSFLDWFASGQKNMIHERIKNIHSGEVFQAEANLVMKDGTNIPYFLSISLLENNGKKYLLGFGLDMTSQKQAEAELRTREERYRIITEMISDYAYAYDIHPDGTFTMGWITDASFQRLTGYTWDETGVTFKLYPPGDAEIARQHVEQTIQGQAASGEYRIVTKGGEPRWLQIQRRVEWDEAHQHTVRFYGAALDITERKQAEEALAKERKLLRTVIDHIPDNIYVKDREGKFLLNNAVSMEIIGVSRQEDLLGKTDFDFFPAPIAQQWKDEHRSILEKGQAVLEQEEYVTWNQAKRRWILGSVIPIHDDQGEIIGFVGINRDITTRKRAELLNEAFLRDMKALQQLLLDLTQIEDMDTLYRQMVTLGRERLDIDRMALFLIDYETNHLQGTYGVDTDGNVRNEHYYNEPITPDHWTLEIFNSPNHTKFWENAPLMDNSLPVDMGWKAASALWDGQQPIGYLITDNFINHLPARPYQAELISLLGSTLGHLIRLKRVNERLRESEEKFRTIFELAPYGIVIQRQGGLILNVNQAFAKQIGYSSAQLQYQNIFYSRSLTIFKDISSAQKLAQELAQIGRITDQELIMYHADGHPMTMLISCQVIQLSGETQIMTIGIDITQRKEAEETLRKSEETARAFQEKLRALHEVSIEASLTRTLDDLFYKAVELGTQKLGFERLSLWLLTDEHHIQGTYGTDESGGIRDESSIFTEIDDDSREVNLVRAGIRAKMWENTTLKGMGKPVGVGWDALAILWDGTQGIGLISIDNYYTKQDPQPYTLDLLALYGNLLGYWITQKRAEAQIQALNAELEHRVEQRTAQLQTVNKELEAFAYSISHDLRAPLRSIDGFSRIVMQKYADTLDAVGQDYLQRTRNATQRMGDMIDALLTLSRITRSELHTSSVDLSAMVHDILEGMAAAEPSRMVKRLVTPGLKTRGDSRLLRVMLENLLQNAWKYTSKRKIAWIEFGSEIVNNEEYFFVKDNGAGFDMANVNKLFAAFQRLHSDKEFPGTGIGLATVQRIISRHNGTIWAKSEIDQGATFYFRFRPSPMPL